MIVFCFCWCCYIYFRYIIYNIYFKAVSRFLRPFVSELSKKLSCEVDADILPAVDPTGSNYIGLINSMVKTGTLAQNQGLYVLQQAEILPKDLPEGETDSTLKGGETNEQY